jgi:hypothetical protein
LFSADPSIHLSHNGVSNWKPARSLTLIRRMKLAIFFNSDVGFETG